MATLIDPVGAAFSLWQPHRFSGWEFPPHTAYAPHGMVPACNEPDETRHFYRETAGAPLADADFITARESVSSALSGNFDVDDLEGVAVVYAVTLTRTPADRLCSEGQLHGGPARAPLISAGTSLLVTPAIITVPLAPDAGAASG
jgi:hypothetical protein